MRSLNVFTSVVLMVTMYATAEIKGGGNCPRGSFEFKTSCYVMINGSFQFDNANEVCKRNGYAHLAYVEDAATYSRLAAHLREIVKSAGGDMVRMWIGRTFHPATKEVKFMDGKIAEWSKWAPGDPTTKPAHTAVFWDVRTDPSHRYGAFWNDHSFWERPVLCERPARRRRGGEL